MIAASIVLALLVDRLCGEVRRCHPLVGFGRVAQAVEARARRLIRQLQGWPATGTSRTPALECWIGALGWLLLVGVPTLALTALVPAGNRLLAGLSGIAVLYFCVGGRSLAEHARAVARPLSTGDLAQARAQVARIVSRDTAQLQRPEVIKATIESVLENGSDAVLAPLFWFAVAGAPGVLCYRLSNTLDAMWGYRNARYLHFGRTAARMDDVLNWIPARCCALSYALAGRMALALRCWRLQAPAWDSPNAGPVIAAGAGALRVLLGGPARYGEQVRWRPVVGAGAAPELADIEASLVLLRRATGIWVAAIAVLEVLAWCAPPLSTAQDWQLLWS